MERKKERHRWIGSTYQRNKRPKKKRMEKKDQFVK